MGAGELIREFIGNFLRKSCYTKRKYYLRILVLFRTFQKLPPLPFPHPEEQEDQLANVAELIGFAMVLATRDEKEGDVDKKILDADDALRMYIKAYCSFNLGRQYQEEMSKARASDQQIDALLSRVKNDLDEKMKELEKKSTKKVNLYVCNWNKAPEPDLTQVDGKVKIEDDATLSMLIHRYMEYKGRTSESFHHQFLRLNPHIYRHFPQKIEDWTLYGSSLGFAKGVMYITSVNPSTTIRTYRNNQGSEDLFLIFDRNDLNRRTIAIDKKKYTVPNGYTTGWLLKGNSTLWADDYAATLRLNSLDYTLYYWDPRTHMDADAVILPEDIKLVTQELASTVDYSKPELTYVSSAAPKFPEPEPYKYPGNPANSSQQLHQSSGSVSSTPHQKGHHGSLSPHRGPALLQQSPTTRALAQPVLQSAPPSRASLQPGPASRQPPSKPQTATQPVTRPAPSSRANVAPSPPNDASLPGPSNSAARQTPPKPDGDPPRKKTASGKDKSTRPPIKGPDAFRRQRQGTEGPNEMIDEDKGGWFGSLIKTGLQKLGAYGGSPKR